MIEGLGAFVLVVAVVSAVADIGTKAYDYAEPKVTQGIEYIEEKLD